jgi:hypothetical protein
MVTNTRFSEEDEFRGLVFFKRMLGYHCDPTFFEAEVTISLLVAFI